VGALHLTKKNRLVDPAWARDRGVELLRVVGRHDQEAAGRFDDAIEHI